MSPISAYRARARQDAEPARILVMLVEEAARRVDLAAAALERGEPATEHLHRARAIYVELIGALDADKLGELGPRLHSLYSWCVSRLIDAGRDRDPIPAREVVPIANTIAETWRLVVAGQAA